MPPLETAGLAIFILFLFLGVYLTIFGLPGTVVILIDVLIYALLSGFSRIGFKVIIILVLIAIVAEAVDVGLNIFGTTRFGASRKAFWASVAGSTIGAAVLAPFLHGLGILAGVFVGGFCGVLVVELFRQGRFRPALKAGYGNICGRVAGILAKGFLAIVMVIITLMNVYS